MHGSFDCSFRELICLAASIASVSSVGRSLSLGPENADASCLHQRWKPEALLSKIWCTKGANVCICNLADHLLIAVPIFTAGGGPASLIDLLPLSSSADVQLGLRAHTPSRPTSLNIPSPNPPICPPPQVAPGDRALRARVISFLHRMVECLGPHLLPLLPSALAALLPRSAQPQDLNDVLALLHQLAVRYKGELAPLISEVRLGCCCVCTCILQGLDAQAPGGACACVR